MSYFAEVIDASVVKPVSNPPPESSFGFGTVKTRNRRVFLFSFDLKTSENNSKSPFYSMWFDHFIGLARIGCVKGGGGSYTPHTSNSHACCHSYDEIVF
jgi:hypothetical protein